MARKEITRDDIMPMDAYGEIRSERRARMVEIKRNRRIPVGPDATFHFESFETMWHQVHEMLFIERGGDDQIEDELRAYNPLIPKGCELVATLMFEIDNQARRTAFLAGLGGVEDTVTLAVNGETIPAVAETDVDRTTANGKASSIQFLHFPFSQAQAEAFKTRGTCVVLGIGHAKYPHFTVLPEPVREALAADLD